jgi:hypothetical protein
MALGGIEKKSSLKDGKKCSACGAINLPGAFGCRSCHSDIEFAEVQQHPESAFKSQPDEIGRSPPPARAVSPFRSFAGRLLARLKDKLNNTPMK